MEKWSADASDKKGRSHKPKIIETKMEIIRHAEHGGYLASIRCSLDVSQSTVGSVVKEKNKTREFRPKTKHTHTQKEVKGKINFPLLQRI